MNVTSVRSMTMSRRPVERLLLLDDHGVEDRPTGDIDVARRDDRPVRGDVHAATCHWYRLRSSGSTPRWGRAAYCAHRF